MKFKNDEYKDRIIDKQIKEYLNIFPAICIEGPKYSGKTWSSLNQSKSVYFVGDPSKNFQNRANAELDANSVLEGDKPRLIDEWQEVPSLWDAVRFISDKDKSKGKFILTGSATPVTKGILHSGTGRIAKIRMATMSLYETGDSDGTISLQSLFDDNLEVTQTKSVDLDELIYFTIRGGWPENLGLSEKSCLNFSKSYLDSIIEDDIYRVDGIKRNQDKLRYLVKSLARNECTIVSNKTLINDVKNIAEEKINNETLNEYLDILKRLFVIEEQLAFSPNARSSVKIGKNVKRHFIDPSLAIAGLGATKDMLRNDLNTFGFIFESLCYHDLKIYAQSIGASIYHYRDSLSREIDVVIQLKDGRWGAFEIKLGNHQIDEAAKNLYKVRDYFINTLKVSGPSILVVISGQSNRAYTREDGVLVVPIYSLKN